MAILKIDFNWEDPLGAKGAELRATWARLAMYADGQPVTRVYDHESRSVRDYVYIPLYPLAEWIALNWWLLLHELDTPGRGTSEDYGRRHSLRFAREGYALPNLEFKPLRDSAMLSWRAEDLLDCRVSFLGTGQVLVSKSSYRDVLGALLSAVVERLGESGLIDTLLQKEWRAISLSSPDETEFCASAAALGLDPYDLSSSERNAIPRIAETLPQEVLQSFLEAAEPAKLLAESKSLNNTVAKLKQRDDKWPGLNKLRSKLRSQLDTPGTDTQSPWSVGYRTASSLRRTLGLNGQLLPKTEDVFGVLGIEGGSYAGLLNLESSVSKAVEGVVVSNSAGGPSLALKPKLHEPSKRFGLCRAIYSYLVDLDGSASIQTRTFSEPQQASRAFAAEFLAPHTALKKRIPGSSLTQYDVEDLATEFGVSSWVIEHQVQNHRLGRLLRQSP